jgi:hypothetical protein
MGLLAGGHAGGVGSLLRMTLICNRYPYKVRRCNADRARLIGSLILIDQELRRYASVTILANMTTVTGRDRQWVWLGKAGRRANSLRFRLFPEDRRNSLSSALSCLGRIPVSAGRWLIISEPLGQLHADSLNQS